MHRKVLYMILILAIIYKRKILIKLKVWGFDSQEDEGKDEVAEEEETIEAQTTPTKTKAKRR